MDADRFDTLLRALSEAPSRRGTLRLLAGFTLGSLLTLGAAPTEAKRKRKKNANKKNKKRRRKCAGKECGGRCGTCQGGRICQSGTCVCPGGTVDCGGNCVNTAADPLNCGSCGTRCQFGATCDTGICTCINGGCHIGNVSCCGVPGAEFTCACGSEGNLFDPATCTFSTVCPAGTVECIGTCRTCCPSGTICDPSTGTCLR